MTSIETEGNWVIKTEQEHEHILNDAGQCSAFIFYQFINWPEERVFSALIE